MAPQIISVVDDAIGVGNDLAQFCVDPTGGSTITVPLTGLPIPSCSGITDAFAVNLNIVPHKPGAGKSKWPAPVNENSLQGNPMKLLKSALYGYTTS